MVTSDSLMRYKREPRIKPRLGIGGAPGFPNQYVASAFVRSGDRGKDARGREGLDPDFGLGGLRVGPGMTMLVEALATSAIRSTLLRTVLMSFLRYFKPSINLELTDN